MANPIEYRIRQADILAFDADVVAFKYAQRFHGADGLAAHRLELDWTLGGKGPAPGETRLIETAGKLGAPRALFVGTPRLGKFSYPEARDFGRTAMAALQQSAPSTRSLAMTVHGPGFGLDEKECLDAQLAGMMEAAEHGEAPPGLESVTVVEFDADRAARFESRFRQIFPPPLRPKGGRRGAPPAAAPPSEARERLGAAGYGSARKPSIFVAMPFAKDMEDIYYYGIERPVNDAGYLCERADLEAFTGDIMDWLKDRIERSTMVIAEVSRPNPNVYLEIGYAWGRRKDVILAASQDIKLPFDIRGHRCLKYEIIRDLEKQLGQLLAGLK